MAALKSIKQTANGKAREWYFHYYGPQERHAREEAMKFGLMDRVVLHGNVPRAEALSAVRGANVAVVITSVFAEDTQEDRGIVTGKLFEPLGLGTPVVLIAPPGADAREIVEETGMGRCFVATDIEGITRFLLNVARVECDRIAGAGRYSWPRLAAKFDRILRGVVALRQTGRSGSVVLTKAHY
jgi:glycosyltransferase involved in cell wall biosynthesis